MLLALDRALLELASEGGVAGRRARYTDNCRVLVDGLRRLGLQTLLDDDLQAPIIVTVLCPADPNFEFGALYRRLGVQGFVIYPGKLTRVDSFRIGCIGRLHRAQVVQLLDALKDTLHHMGVRDCAPNPEVS